MDTRGKNDSDQITERKFFDTRTQSELPIPGC